MMSSLSVVNNACVTIEGRPSSDRRSTNRGLSLMKQGIGNVLYSEKLYSIALRFYTEAIGLYPETATLISRANSHIQLHEHKKALEDAKKCVELDAKSFQGHRLIATCALALGDVEMAREELLQLRCLLNESLNEEEAQELRKLDEVYALHEEADKAYAKENYSGAIKLMEKILELLPCRKMKIRRAECLALLEKYEEADEMASNILILDKSNVDALYVLGLCSYYQGSLDLSIKRLKRLLKLSPTHEKAKALLNKASVIKSKIDVGSKACEDGSYRKSYKLFTEALEVDPNNKRARTQLFLKRAKISFKLCKPRDAINDCSEALRINGYCLEALLMRAKLYMSLKDYELAVSDYENVCKINNSYEYKLLLKHAKMSINNKPKARAKTFYGILGISSDATQNEIRCAYHKKSLLHHPDRHSSATEETRREQELLFKEVGHAYKILSDPQKRADYDHDCSCI